MNSENMGTATIGQIIKHYREVFGFTQKQLAQKLGISPSAIANYELNYSYPRREILEKMAVVFNVSYNYLNTFKISNNGTPPAIPQISYGYYKNSIYFFSAKNLNGIRTRNAAIADSILELPTAKKFDVDNLISTEITDNSMINAGLPASTYIIINPNRNLVTNNIVAVIDNVKNKLIVRRISKDGPVIHLTADGYGDNTAITTYLGDENYSIIGTVVAAMSKLKFLDN